MKVIIVEDEKYARENLEKLLQELQSDIVIQAELDTVSGTVKWLQQHQTDLIFLDINLADDLSFKIFEQIEVQTPIIFTTAYDKYAIKAFKKIHSIDYLLKPIDKEELRQALEKFQNLQALPKLPFDYVTLAKVIQMEQQKNYKERFMVTSGGRIKSFNTQEIAYFEGEDRYVFLVTKNQGRFIVDFKLNELEGLLSPKDFFRLNRSFITHFQAIEYIVILSKSRVDVSLKPKPKRKIRVSSKRTKLFKAWLDH